MARSLTVQFWNDLICPICPIGHAKLKAGIELFPHKDSVEVAHRSSRLRPGVPPPELSGQNGHKRKGRFGGRQRQKRTIRPLN
jgi:predicted DsbA family dithiol-disulfide isomerase